MSGRGRSAKRRLQVRDRITRSSRRMNSPMYKTIYAGSSRSGNETWCVCSAPVSYGVSDTDTSYAAVFGVDDTI